MVAQAEAAISGAYAPVTFQSAKPFTPSTGPFAGITFYPDASTTSEGSAMSAHAQDVGQQIYASGTTARAYVSSVRTMTSNDLLSILSPAGRGGSAPAPQHLPGSAKVLNASFAGSAGTLSLDAGLLARMDLLVDRDGVVAVAGAVTDTTGSFAGATLIWAAPDVVAVRGSNPDTPFDPAGNTVGRSYADLWDSGLASDATGDVSAMAVTLVGRAMAAKRTDLAKPAMVRALLMTGADRTTDAGSEAWVPNLANGLSTDMGAGQASLAGAEAAAAAPVVSFLAAGKSTLKVKASPGAVTSGLGSTTLGARGTVVSLFRLSTEEVSVTATLAWDTVRSTNAAGDLRIELIPVTISAKGVATLSAAPVLSMDAPGDNVRFVTSSQGFAAGTYAWVIENVGKVTLSPSLVYAFDETATLQTNGVESSSAEGATGLDAPPHAGIAVVPEVGGMGWVLVGAVLGVRRRR